MEPFIIPTCYFPSTVVFVDDNRDFLLNFVLHLDEGLAYRVFDSPLNALECIQDKRCEFALLNQRCIREYTDAKNCPLANQNLNHDFAAIHAEVYNPCRFSEISTIVVDYAMPDMDGLEFCRLIEDTHVKKILLIGQADEFRAVEAFNAGLIQGYIRKNDPNLAQEIIKSIHAVQLQYFQEMSDLVVRMLYLTPPSCLKDQQFATIFWEIIQKHKIVEFYLVDNSGSFILLDEDANISFLMVKNEADMRLHYDLAMSNGASMEVLEQLRKREKIPCFWQSNSSTSQWSNCLVPANQCLSTENYYYAYVQGAVLFDVHLNKIVAYHKYLEELDATEMFVGCE